MKNMFCFLIYHFYVIYTKLIGSNTLQEISSTELYDKDINLTVWIQFRFPIKFQQTEEIDILKIIDQDYNLQVLIYLQIIDESLIRPNFILQNRTLQIYELNSNDWRWDWQKISIQRDICFNRLEYFDINMSVPCADPFNATLFISQSISFHIYVYDMEQFENEDIILSNIFLKDNKYIINTLKNNLVVQFYAKLYRGQDAQIFFFFNLMSSESYFYYQQNQNNIEICLQSEDKQNYLIQNIQINGDQWVLFSMEFKYLDVIIQYNTSNTNHKVVVQIDHYFSVTIAQYLQYYFKTFFVLVNTQSTVIKYLQIISLIATKVKNSCTDDCQFCLYNQCFDQEKPQLDFNISNQIKSSIYYNESYFENYQLMCNDKRYYFKNQQCIEFPKYQGKYCYNCQYLQRSIAQLNDYNYLGLRSYSYDYYLESLYYIKEVQTRTNNGLFLETDLNIYIFNGKDIYMTLKLYNHVFCEIGYQFLQKCKKILKKCQIQILTCLVCQEQYAVINNRCIRCQKNCLYCKIIRNKLTCILFRSNYYENDQGMIKQCLKNSDILICQPKDQAINQLTRKEYKVCQCNEVYDIDLLKCQDLKHYKDIFKFLKYYPNQKYQEQFLEIQDILADRPGQLDSQLLGLISIEQMNKLAGQVQKYNQMQSLLNMNKNFELLSQMNSSLEEIASKKITLYDVQIYLQENPIIIYDNKAYGDLIEIALQLQIDTKIIQFNIEFRQHIIEKNQFNQFEMNCEKYSDITFIFNISFNFNPSILYYQNTSIQLRANQIIIHSLLFDKINKQFYENQDENLDETLISYYIFLLISEKITIYNLTIKNIQIERIIFVYHFNDLKIYNLYIKNSSLTNFIKAARANQIYSIVKISDIYCERCNLTYFIDLVGAQAINIFNIYYVASQLYIHNFLFTGSLNSIYINNLQLIQVNLIGCMLIVAKYKDKNDDSIFNMSNFQVSESTLKNSVLLLLQNVNSMFLTQIYVYYLQLHQSYFINTIYNINSHLESFYIYELNVQNYLPLIKINQYDQTTFKDFYFYNFKLIKQQFIYLKGIRTLIDNLNFNQLEITVVNLITIDSGVLEILKLMMCNLVSGNQEIVAEEIIKLISKKLNIQGIVFNYAHINEIRLFRIQTNEALIFKYLYLLHLTIISNNQELLILFEGFYNHNFISNIYLRSISIKARDKNYALMTFNNICKFRILIIQVIYIQNESLLSTIYIIYTDVLQMEIYNVRMKNTNAINLLFSSSGLLLIKYVNLNNIVRKIIDYSPFIMHKSPSINYHNESMWISHFKVNYFEGIFINVQTDSKMFAYLNRLSFDYPISIYEFIQFKSLILKYTQLQISSVQITNQIEVTQKSQKGLIETNFQHVSLTRFRLQQINQQVLRTYQTPYIQIIGVYVNQYYFNDSVILIKSDAFPSLIKINQFIIYNSSIEKGSVFDFSLKVYHILFDTIQFSDLYVGNSVIKLVSTYDQQIKLSNILLESVTSDKYLFQIEQQVSYFTTSLIRVITPQIFSSNNKKIGYINGLITSIIEKCLLSPNSLIFLNQSEIVNSNIIQHQDQIIRYQSQYLGMFTNVNSNMMIFFSLNRGQSFFDQLPIYDNVYQIQFSKNNSHLYLPSGRDIQGYQYFNFAKREYTRLYDSISYFSLYQAQTTQCILKQKFNNETILEQDLLLQPGLNQIHNLTFTLNPYYKDKHIELDLICNQNESKITYRTLIKTFNCQLGEFLFKDQCLLCNIEQNSYSVGYNQQYCLMKDSNIIEKLNVGQIKLQKTYWRQSYANKYIEQCKSQNCLGGWHTGDQSCKVGYVGAICSECDVYNIRGQGSFGQIDNQCSICYFDYSIYLKGMLIIMFQLLLIYISQNTNQQLSQQFLFIRISKRKFTEILCRQNINQVTVLFKLYYNYIFTIYLLKESIDFGQVVDLSLNMVYNPSFIAVPQFDCLIYSLFQYPIQYTQLIIKILLPISLLNFVVIIYALMIKFQASKYSIYIIIVCLLIIHQQHQQVILQSLIKLLSPIKYSNIYWTLENLNIEYYSKTHQYYLFVLVIPLIAIITFMNILIFMWIKYINKRIFVHLKLSLFIYKQYKNQYYYWEYFRLASIYLYMIILYSLDNTYIIQLTLFILTISHIYRPFQLQNINQIDQIIYIISLYTYLGILIQSDDSPNKFIIIIISNLILLKIFLKYFFHSLNIQYKQQKVQYLNKVISYVPKLGTYINTQTYHKTEYYYNLLKLSRKQKTAMNTIVQSTISQIIPEVQKIEVEMAQINKVQ